MNRAYLYYGPFEDATDITFNWNTTNATPGKHILKASIAPVTGEEDVADNVLTATVNIKIPQYLFYTFVGQIMSCILQYLW